MRRAERLFRLVNAMRARSITRAQDLAAELEVSTRTLYRDIAHLQASGLPIEGAAGVGYLLRPGFNLPGLAFTHDQIAALAVGLSFVQSRGDADLVAAAREVLAKLQAGMPDPQTRALADAPYFNVPGPRNDMAHAGPLRRAIRKRLLVQLTYADASGQRSDRQVQPLAVWTFPEGAMMSGWCRLRQDFRTFRLDRILGLIVTETVFAPDPAQSLAAFLAQDACAS